MENISINFMIILYDEDNEVLEKLESKLKIESNISPKTTKQYLKVFDENDKDITKILKEYISINKKNENVNSCLVNFFTDKWDYLFAKELYF